MARIIGSRRSVGAIMAPKIQRSFQLLLVILVVVLEGWVFLLVQVGGISTEAVTSTDVILHPAAVKQHFTVPVRNMTHLNDATLRTPLYPVNTTFHSPNFSRPVFREIVKDHRNNVIVGDVQFLLDFAIIGHAKCGTSTKMEWLGNHPQVECTDGETPHLALCKMGLFCKRMYNALDADPMKLRAYKNPTDIQNLRALRLLRELFPQAKLLIGIRHPVLWFQSFYNHRIQNTGDMMPNPDLLAGACFKNNQNVLGSFQLPFEFGAFGEDELYVGERGRPITFEPISCMRPMSLSVRRTTF